MLLRVSPFPQDPPIRPPETPVSVLLSSIEHLVERRGAAALSGVLLQLLLFHDRVDVVVSTRGHQVGTLYRIVGERMLQELMERKLLRFVMRPGVGGYISPENKRTLTLKAEPGLAYFQVLGERGERLPEAQELFAASRHGLKEEGAPARLARTLARLAERHGQSVDGYAIFTEQEQSMYEHAHRMHSEAFALQSLEDWRSFSQQKNQDQVRSLLDVAAATIDIHTAAQVGAAGVVGKDCTWNIACQYFDQVARDWVSDVVKSEALLEVVDFERLLHSEKPWGFNDLLRVRDDESNWRTFRKWLRELPGSEEPAVIRRAIWRDGLRLKATAEPWTQIRVGLLQFGTAILETPERLQAIAMGTIVDGTLTHWAAKKWSPKLFIEKHFSYGNGAAVPPPGRPM